MLFDILQKPRRILLISGHYLASGCGGAVSLIESAGGVNVASELKGGWAEVSAEQLVQWNPDVIVAVQYCGEDCDPASIKANPQHAQESADSRAKWVHGANSQE